MSLDIEARPSTGRSILELRKQAILLVLRQNIQTTDGWRHVPGWISKRGRQQLDPSSSSANRQSFLFCDKHTDDRWMAPCLWISKRGRRQLDPSSADQFGRLFDCSSPASCRTISNNHTEVSSCPSLHLVPLPPLMTEALACLICAVGQMASKARP
jgi:hypothetical protein